MSDNRESARTKQLERGHILDEATRNRRQRKALEALEKDNYQEDLPTLSSYVSDYRIQLNKKFQQKFTISETNLNEAQKESTTSSSASNLLHLVNSSSSIGGGNNEADSAGNKRKRIKSESKLRFRKNYATLLEEEREFATDKEFSYFSIAVTESKFPPRKFCSVCGYTCIQCGSKYCTIRCQQTHKDTRCLKWTA